VGVPSGATFCSSIARYQSSVVSPRVLCRRFLPNSSSTRPRSSVTRRTYLERVHALALVVEIIHQIPAFTNVRAFTRVATSVFRSVSNFVPSRRRIRPIDPFRSVPSRPVRSCVSASRVDPSSGVIAIEFVRSFVRSFAGTHMSSSSSSSSDDSRRSSKSFESQPPSLSREPSV